MYYLVYTLHTWVCTVGDNVTINSSDGRLPEQQSFSVCDVDCSQTAGFIQSCNTHKGKLLQYHNTEEFRQNMYIYI